MKTHAARKLAALLAGSMVLAFLAACSGSPQQPTPPQPAPAEQPQPAPAEEPQPSAPAPEPEGEVVLYTSFGQDEVQSILAVFEAKYPNIKTKFYRASSGAVLEKWISEVEAGVPSADVVLIAFPSAWPDLKEQGLFMQYDSPVYADFPPEMQDPGYTVVGRIHVYGPFYNTNLVPPETAKKLSTLEDWIALAESADYQGRFSIMDPVTIGGSAEAIYQWKTRFGPEKFQELMNRIGAAGVQLSTGGGDTMAKVVSGQWAFAFDGASYRALGAKATGAPVEWVTTEGSVLVPTPMSISSKAPHPTAAKVLFDWWNSREGQQTMVNLTLVHSGRPDVQPPAGVPSVKDMNGIFLPVQRWAEPASQRDQLLDDLRATKVVR